MTTNDDVLQVVTCGPQSSKCRCQCPDGHCDHKWDGEGWEGEDGLSGSSTCSRCGMIRMEHDTWVGP